MLNIAIPMAGRGQRFADAGYELPKPLISIHGQPMIHVVLDNLTPTCDHRFIFLILREHAEQYEVDKKLLQWAPGSVVVYVDEVTQGAACTVLLAREFIENDDPLMIANCDQYIDTDIDAYIASMGDADGLIMTMWADDPKWSFVRRNSQGRVVQVVEKQVVSNEATVGIYNFRRGSDFVKSVEAMMAADLRVNNEFYVAPAYDQMIQNGARIECFDIGRIGAGMHGIGVPTDLTAFTEHPVSRRAISKLEARSKTT